jgi:branched-chain amino acid transport system permease protein
MLPLAQALLSGVLAGGAYALLGAGLALVLGVVRVVHLAHGALAMLGMLLAWLLAAQLGWDPLPSLLLVAPGLFLLGALLQLAVVGRASGLPPERRLLLTLGLGLALSGAAALAFGAGRRTLPGAGSPARLEALGLSVTTPRAAAFLVAAAALAGLGLFLSRTGAGRALRAVAQDRQAASLVGIDLRRAAVLAAGIGAALAGVAGDLAAQTSAISPRAAVPLTLGALASAALGGMRSVPGAALGGLVVGVAESLANATLGGDAGELAAGLLLLVALVVRPPRLLDEARA